MNRDEQHNLPAKPPVTAKTLRQLREGQIDAVCIAGASANPADRAGKLIFPGAFHPLHAGHRLMAKVAEQMRGVPVEFEISVVNVDKPPLEDADILARIAQFPADRTVWLTHAATFVEKSQLFPSSVFLVGVDTIVRIADPHYYRGDSSARDLAINELAQHGCGFLVFGRRRLQGFQTLRHLTLPPELRRICVEVSEHRFRVDISSTELRE